MGPLSGAWPATTSSTRWYRREPGGPPWLALVVAFGCAGSGVALIASGAVPAGAGLVLAGLAIAVLWFLPVQRRGPLGGNPLSAAVMQRASCGDPDLYLDLDAVEVHAVYRLGPELYAHLRGGIGQRVDPGTGDRRPIETSDVSLTWRCSGRRSAQKLASQLNEWEARHTPLRLLAIRGSCALLIEDDSTWVTLPELRLAA